jgi:copper chaperone NosL
MKGKIILTPLLAMLLIVLAGCEPKPQPIQFGSDQGDYCRMMITEPQFASQILNNQGRAFKFDSIECMAAYAITAGDPGNIHSHWVPNFTNPDEWLQAEEAFFLHSETLRSPMGLYLSAYPDRETAEEYRQEYRGEIVGWDEVKKIVEAEWLAGSGNRQHMN